MKARKSPTHMQKIAIVAVDPREALIQGDKFSAY